MDFTNARIDINSYVAKYMDENGLSLKEACEDLGINESAVFNQSPQDELY